MNIESNEKLKYELFIKRYSRLIIGILALAIFFTSYWLWFDFRSFLKEPIQFSSQDQVLTIKKGTGVNRLVNQLYTKKIITKPLYFKILSFIKPEYKKLKVGEYLLGARMTPDQLLTQLSQGIVIQYSFTIIEGQTWHEIIQNLAKEERLSALESSAHADLISALNIDSVNLEGWLFPETYYFTKGDTALSVLTRASQSMITTLKEEWSNRSANLPYQSAYEALIMASIIEKETGVPYERAEIAGVFVRRLQKKMRLQTDPTVIYGIGPDFNGDITRRDLKTPTAYNTYVIKGLPPTPIAMPSRESIHAALHPKSGSTLYFVADGSGGHYFSETLQEHQQAVNRMLKRNREAN